MRKFFKKLWRVVVGSPAGFAGEGNEQWYYTLALAMSCMLAWTFLPEVALVFTIISVIHLITVHVFGMNGWENDRNYCWGYFGVHALLFVIALLFNWWWTFVTAAITIVAVLFAPDCVVESVMLRRFSKIAYEEEKLNKFAMICHTCIFVLFVIVTCLLPTVWWAKLLIIAAFMGLHFHIDLLEGECVNVYESADNAFYVIVNGTLEEQMQKYLEEEKNKQENTGES